MGKVSLNDLIGDLQYTTASTQQVTTTPMQLRDVSL